MLKGAGMQAHRQVVECRRILKWTYAYGFYRFDTIPLEQDAAEEHSDVEGDEGPRLTPEERARAAEQLKEMKNRKEFFEFLQGDAETALERLSDALEKDLTRYYSREEFWRDTNMHRNVVPNPWLHACCVEMYRNVPKRLMSPDALSGEPTLEIAPICVAKAKCGGNRNYPCTPLHSLLIVFRCLEFQWWRMMVFATRCGVPRSQRSWRWQRQLYICTSVLRYRAG